MQNHRGGEVVVDGRESAWYTKRLERKAGSKRKYPTNCDVELWSFIPAKGGAAELCDWSA